MNDVQENQGQLNMQLIEIIREALETGVLTMSAERKLYKLLNSRNFDEMEVHFVDQMIDALRTGRIQSIA